jgi:hypothetical protein
MRHIKVDAIVDTQQRLAALNFNFCTCIATVNSDVLVHGGYFM